MVFKQLPKERYTWRQKQWVKTEMKKCHEGPFEEALLRQAILEARGGGETDIYTWKRNEKSNRVV